MRIAVICTSYKQALNLYNTYKDDTNIFFEFRLDHDPTLIELVGKVPSNRIILTMRSEAEGGKQSDFPIENLLQYNVAYVDFEIYRDQVLAIHSICSDKLMMPKNFILSYHNFDDDLSEAFRKLEEGLKPYPQNLRNYENVIVKFVCKPVDTLGAIRMVDTYQDMYPKHILLGITRHSDILRTFADKYSQELVFGSHSELNIIPAKKLRDINSTQNPVMLGLIGKNIQHSKSPAIHDIFLNQTSNKGYYHLLEVTDESKLEQMVSFLKENGFTGFNVTNPYKYNIFKILDNVDNRSQLVKAVNAVKISEGKLIGYNTDVSGFMNAYPKLREYNEIIIFGAGGAARAVSVACLEMGLKVSLVMRNQDRKKEFSEELLSKISVLRQLPDRFTGVLINATPLGRSDKDILAQLPQGIEAIVDINYYQTKSIWQQKAEDMGIGYIDGEEMLYHQAADAFEIWTGEVIKR